MEGGRLDEWITGYVEVDGWIDGVLLEQTSEYLTYLILKRSLNLDDVT